MSVLAVTVESLAHTNVSFFLFFLISIKQFVNYVYFALHYEIVQLI
jgi:hypothetical protein